MANNENVTASEFINPMIKSSVRIYGIFESQFQILAKETISMACFDSIGKPELKYVLLSRVVVVVVALHAINRARTGHLPPLYYLGICIDNVDGPAQSGHLSVCPLAICLVYELFMGCSVMEKIW